MTTESPYQTHEVARYNIAEDRLEVESNVEKNILYNAAISVAHEIYGMHKVVTTEAKDLIRVIREIDKINGDTAAYDLLMKTSGVLLLKLLNTQIKLRESNYGMNDIINIKAVDTPLDVLIEEIKCKVDRIIKIVKQK